MRIIVLVIYLSGLAVNLRADTSRDRMDAYVRRYAAADLLSGVVRVTCLQRVQDRAQLPV
jgi:hypothetical protein